jgi:hypothetical protein
MVLWDCVNILKSFQNGQKLWVLRKIVKIHKNLLYSTYTYRRKRKLMSGDADLQFINDKNTQF